MLDADGCFKPGKVHTFSRYLSPSQDWFLCKVNVFLLDRNRSHYIFSFEPYFFSKTKWIFNVLCSKSTIAQDGRPEFDSQSEPPFSVHLIDYRCWAIYIIYTIVLSYNFFYHLVLATTRQNMPQYCCMPTQTITWTL